MHIKTRIIKLFFYLLIFFAILECAYLFVVPPIINTIISKDTVKNYINNNINADIQYNNLLLETHIKPYITLKVKEITIKDKENTYTFLNADKLKIKISIIDLITKKINIKKLEADSLYVNLKQNKDGIFNFEILFPDNTPSKYKPVLKNNSVYIKNYTVNVDDETINKSIKIEGNTLSIKLKDKKNIEIITNGKLFDSEDKSDFDINMTVQLPLFQNLNNSSIKGKCFLYNIDLNMFSPYLKKFIDNDIKTITGNINYLQISTSNNEENKNQIVLNTLFNDIVFDKNSWKNHIIANGENKIDTRIELNKKNVFIDFLSYKAKDVNIKTSGFIDFKNKHPYLDINVKVLKSKAENIVPILPPNLLPTYKTIEKVKTYGVFGDINCDINAKGNIPQPDITGYVEAKNVHILDKSIHNLHKGNVNIKFDKRILNMDIDIDLFDNQKAKVDGYVYMFRDGVNNVTVKTTDNIDFPLAQKIIIPVSKVFNFQLGPIPEMDIKTGKGIIDVNIKGSIDFVNINGFAAFKDASLFYNGLYGKIEKGIGQLDFKDDIISFKSQKAFVKTNPININGTVRINKNLDFTVSSECAEAKDLLEFINKSSLLKDVKKGMAVITDALGPTRIIVNMKAKIVPVPFGHPPLPPEEAFEDMKVKGTLYLLNNSCFLEGFYTPIEYIKGFVDFTETLVEFKSIKGISGSSPIEISGQIITDLETKIPDVDIIVTGKEVKLKDTIKFLTKSYLYPENYPDLSSLYKIASKHDLFFKYKAKSVDFLTDKAYAVLNFLPDKEDNPIKAKSGKIVMDKATVTVDNIDAVLYDSNLNINGRVNKIDTVNPIYNLTIKSDDFNLENLNDTSKVTIMPDEIRKLFTQFTNFKGISKINLVIDKNILKGDLLVKGLKMQHRSTKCPFNFDNFKVYFHDNKILINNMTLEVSDMPVFGDLEISNYYTKPRINGYITTKLTNNFVKTYLPDKLSENFTMQGDIGFSSKINGSMDNLTIEPKLVLNPDADVIIGGINIGDIDERREFAGKINILRNKISINDFKYTKLISSQNNKTYPIVFANASGNLEIKPDNIIEPVDFQIKTNKNLPARILNILLKTPILKQGTFNCDLKYKASKLHGDLDCHNIDIPLFNTLVKRIKLNAENEKISLTMFGFVADSKIRATAEMKNNLLKKPQITSLNIIADQIDRNKLFNSFSDIHKAMNTNNKIRNIDLSGLSILNGHLEVKELLVKSLSAKNLIADFSIDEEGIFNAKNMTIDIGQGNMAGAISYNLSDTTVIGDFKLNNVDSNYVAQTLLEGKNQIYGNANGRLYIKTKGSTDSERIKNLSGSIYFDIYDGKMPKLGSLEYLLRAGNILKSGITGFTLNSILELLNLVKTGYFSNIHGKCTIENGIADNIEIYSKGENMSLYIHGTYDIATSNADMEVLGKLSKRISTIFGKVGNTSLNTFFKLIPGISFIDFGRKDFIEDVEKIPSFTNGEYEARVFQALINGNINETGYVQSFKWVK